LPDIQQGVGISESKNDESRIDSQDALDIFGWFFDIVGVDGFVGSITDVAFPVNKVLLIVFADYHGVGEKHLIDVGEGKAGDDEERG